MVVKKIGWIFIHSIFKSITSFYDLAGLLNVQ